MSVFDDALALTGYFDALVQRMTPRVFAAYLKAIRDIARALDVDAITKLVERGQVAAVVDAVLNDRIAAAGLAPIQEAIREVVAKAGARFFKDAPPAPASDVPIARVRFNALDQNVLAAVAEYESFVLGKMTESVRETVRQATTTGLQSGVNPRDIARGLKDVLGLAANQEVYIRNYRDELIRLDSGALRRELTDGNFDRTVAAAIRDGRRLTAAEIERGVTRYRKNWQRAQAETVSRTVTLNALREAQRMSWQQAIDAGMVDESELVETWITKLDGRERPTHHQMNGAQKPFDGVWLVPGAGPQRYPGETEYNCRCRVWIAPRIRRASELRRSPAPPSPAA